MCPLGYMRRARCVSGVMRKVCFVGGKVTAGTISPAGFPWWAAPLPRRPVTGPAQAAAPPLFRMPARVLADFCR